MNKKAKYTIFVLLPLALGVFLIWLQFRKLPPEGFKSILESFKHADYKWIALSLLFGILSHISRAYRWRFLLEPLGYKPKFANCLMTVGIGYFMNLGIPRSGEVARAAAISKVEHMPFNKTFGTIVIERVADVIMLLLIIASVFFSQFTFFIQFLEKNVQLNPLSLSLIFIGFLIVLFIGYKLLKNPRYHILLKINIFLKGLAEGIKSIAKTDHKWAFLFHTIFIWVMYILMFYATTFAMPETSHLPISAILAGFVIGGLSIALTNGGIGAYPIGVQQVLLLYGINKISGLAFGWLMWSAQTIMVIIFGGLSMLILPIYNNRKKKNK